MERESSGVELSTGKGQRSFIMIFRMQMYFAYGSNLWQPRLECRVGPVQSLGVASLGDFELRWHKRSSDGSGKCDIVRKPGSTVLGVIYAISNDRMAVLDEVEGVGAGYQRDEDLVVLLRGDTNRVVTYRAESSPRGPATPTV